jgi:hypothetical protein
MLGFGVRLATQGHSCRPRTLQPPPSGIRPRFLMSTCTKSPGGGARSEPPGDPANDGWPNPHAKAWRTAFRDVPVLRTIALIDIPSAR